MGKRDYIDFQTPTQPLAYLITFRCYGTWLHGEVRGSIDRRRYHRYGTRDMPPNKKILSDEVRTLKSEPVLLDKRQRAVVDGAIREVCVQRKYSLYAVNVRTNHVHVVVGTSRTPEIVMNSFKSYATRKLREASLVSADLKPWARHGSTRYLWTEEQLSQGIEYVMFGQGNELFR
jgi:REP element-mobilizing transposase RayT